MHQLHVLRQEGERAEHGDTADERDDVGNREDLHLEQSQRQDRLGSHMFPDHEADEEDHAGDEQADDLPRPPRVVGAAGLGAEQDGRDTQDQQQCTPPVDLYVAGALG